MSGIYIWMWIIVANAGALVALSTVGGSTSSMTSRDRFTRDDHPRDVPRRGDVVGDAPARDMTERDMTGRDMAGRERRASAPDQRPL